jgi:hypothetical protein
MQLDNRDGGSTFLRNVFHPYQTTQRRAGNVLREHYDSRKTNGIWRTDGKVNIITNPSTAIVSESFPVTKWNIGETRQ